MRLAVAFCLTFAAVIVESRPSTLPTDVSKVSYRMAEVITMARLTISFTAQCRAIDRQRC
jgi:hypothetical protein